MNESASSNVKNSADSSQAGVSPLFADLVLRQMQMALLLMGRVEAPEKGKSYRDLEQARLAIDQLEMLESKTRGNLTREEEAFLKQSLMTVRLAFVEEVDASATEPKPAGEKAGSESGTAKASTAADQQKARTEQAEEGPHKKFVKKY